MLQGQCLEKVKVTILAGDHQLGYWAGWTETESAKSCDRFYQEGQVIWVIEVPPHVDIHHAGRYD